MNFSLRTTLAVFESLCFHYNARTQELLQCMTNTSDLKGALFWEYRWKGEDEQGPFERSVDLRAIAPSQGSRLL